MRSARIHIGGAVILASTLTIDAHKGQVEFLPDLTPWMGCEHPIQLFYDNPEFKIVTPWFSCAARVSRAKQEYAYFVIIADLTEEVES
jgi:hypothetical protein